MYMTEKENVLIFEIKFKVVISPTVARTWKTANKGFERDTLLFNSN